MEKLFLVFNHSLTDSQRKDAIENLGISEIVEMPGDLKKIWSAIPPEGDLDISQLKYITDWLDQYAVKNDYVIVQGDFGAVFYIVDFAFYKGFIPVYATTKREYEERVLDDGSVERKHIFKHVSFRKYRIFEGECDERVF